VPWLRKLAQQSRPSCRGSSWRHHYRAGQPQYAIQLIKCMWADFILDDPRMTNSTFIEGYSTNGDVHDTPYTNNLRISHAHGWATGPLSALMFCAAGLQMTRAVEKTWRAVPGPGGLVSMEVGFETGLGSFACNAVAGKGRMKARLRCRRGRRVVLGCSIRLATWRRRFGMLRGTPGIWW
jgi:hypothetical protein